MTWAEDINVCTFVSFPAAVKRKEEGGWPGVGGWWEGGDGRWEDGRDGRVCVGGMGTEEEGKDRKPMEPSSHLIPLVCSFCGIKKHAEDHLL